MNKILGIGIPILFIGLVISLIICGIITEIKTNERAKEICNNNGFVLWGTTNTIRGVEGFLPFKPIKIEFVKCMSFDENKEVIVRGDK